MHVEVGEGAGGHDEGRTDQELNDNVHTLDSEELRDQMAAQVRASKLKITSAASLQLCWYWSIAYCCRLPVRDT